MALRFHEHSTIWSLASRMSAEVPASPASDKLLAFDIWMELSHCEQMFRIAPPAFCE
jgi:hypothetical protein